MEWKSGGEKVRTSFKVYSPLTNGLTAFTPTKIFSLDSYKVVLWLLEGGAVL